MSVKARLILVGAFAALAYLTVNHFLLTFFYLTPSNPLKVELTPALHAWASDLFIQNWSLFAPTPIHNNSAMMVRFRSTDGKVSDWYNISDAMIQGLHEHPYGPYVRLVRIHMTGARYYQGFGTPESEKLREVACAKVPQDDPEYCQREDSQTKELREAGKRILQRYASAVGRQYAEMSGVSVADLQVRLLRGTVRPYSQRANPDWKPEVVGMDTEWLPMEEVAPLPVQILKGVSQDEGTSHDPAG